MPASIIDATLLRPMRALRAQLILGIPAHDPQANEHLDQIEIALVGLAERTMQRCDRNGCHRNRHFVPPADSPAND